MEIRAIASGSGGNFYVLTAPSGAQLMLECGIPWKTIMRAMDFDFKSCSGCLLTHEHRDHAAAAAQLVKHGIKIYASAGTLNALGINYGVLGPAPLREKVWAKIGDFEVLPVKAIHDAAETFMFIVMDAEDTLLFATDTQYIPVLIKGLTKIMVEANYDLNILNANYIDNGDVGPRKRRIIGTHMGIDTLEAWLRRCSMDCLKEIHLIHLSKENSDPESFVKRIQSVTGVPVYAETG